MPPPYCYDYPRPAVTVDLVVFALSGEDLMVLLIRRKRDPFAGSWALPGGFLEIDEAMEDGARRELEEETGLARPGPLAFLGVFGDPGRDPRGRTFSMAHAAVVRGTSQRVKGSDDAEEAAWRVARGHGHLAFDHDAILARALGWLESAVQSGSDGLCLLPEEFDETEVRGMFRAVFGKVAGASRWLGRMEREGRVEHREGSGKLFHAVVPGSKSPG